MDEIKQRTTDCNKNIKSYAREVKDKNAHLLNHIWMESIAEAYLKLGERCVCFDVKMSNLNENEITSFHDFMKETATFISKITLNDFVRNLKVLLMFPRQFNIPFKDITEFIKYDIVKNILKRYSNNIEQLDIGQKDKINQLIQNLNDKNKETFDEMNKQLNIFTTLTDGIPFLTDRISMFMKSIIDDVGSNGARAHQSFLLVSQVVGDHFKLVDEFQIGIKEKLIEIIKIIRKNFNQLRITWASFPDKLECIICNKLPFFKNGIRSLFSAVEVDHTKTGIESAKCAIEHARNEIKLITLFKVKHGYNQMWFTSLIHLFTIDEIVTDIANVITSPLSTEKIEGILILLRVSSISDDENIKKFCAELRELDGWLSTFKLSTSPMLMPLDFKIATFLDDNIKSISKLKSDNEPDLKSFMKNIETEYEKIYGKAEELKNDFKEMNDETDIIQKHLIDLYYILMHLSLDKDFNWELLFPIIDSIRVELNKFKIMLAKDKWTKDVPEKIKELNGFFEKVRDAQFGLPIYLREVFKAGGRCHSR